MAILSPKEIAKVNLEVVPALSLDVLNKAVIVSTGGTNTDTLTVTQVNDLASAPLADSIPVTSSQHIFGKMTAQVPNNILINTLVSHAKVISGLTWATGSATITATAHGLPDTKDVWVVVEGCVPTEWNGTRRATVSGLNDIVIQSDVDYGALTTMGKVCYAEATVTHALPVTTPHDNNIYYVGICQATGTAKTTGFYNTSVPAFALDSNTLYYPLKETTSTPPTTARLRYVKGTLASHGLPQDEVSIAYIDQTSPAIANGHNGIKNLTATSASEFYYPTVQTTSASTKGRISSLLVTTAAAHGQPIGVLQNVVVDGTSIASHNRTADYLAATATTLTGPAVFQSSQGTATGGRMLDTDAFNLNTALNGFFAQGGDIPVWVLELGSDTTANHIAAFGNWLLDNHMFYINYHIPDGWDTAAFATIASNYCGNLDFTHFVTSLSAASNKALFVDQATGLGYKSILPYIEDVDAQGTESLGGRLLYEITANLPSAANPIRQINYRYLKAAKGELTPYSGADRADLEREGITYIDVNANGLDYPYKIVGGYTGDSINSGGVTAQFIDYMQWWSTYYAALSMQSALDQRVIDSANNPAMRLNLDDTGGVQCVADLRATCQNVVDNKLVPFGAVNNTTVEAVPYATWKGLNQAAYTAKHYDGLTVTIVPRRGFREVTLNMTANFNG